MKGEQTILFESNRGVRFTRIDYVKRSMVEVRKGEYLLHRYRFNNLPEYKHKLLSWENLNCCNGWVYDPSYLLYHAVQEGRKLVANESLSLPEGSGMPSADQVEEMLSVDRSEVDLSVYRVPDNPYVSKLEVGVNLARKGSLRDFFDMEEILEAYLRHDVWLSRRS